MFRSFYLFAFFFYKSLFFCAQVIVYTFYPYWPILFSASLDYCQYQISKYAVFMLYKEGLIIRNIWKRLVVIVFAVLLLFCQFLFNELTQRRSEKKKLSFDDKFS